jgi:hypothetical protein
MPTNVVIIVTGVTLAFLIFAATLAWADHYSRGMRQSGTSE